MSISQNYQRLLENVAKTAEEGSRTAKEITIVVAGKYSTTEQLKEVIAAGARHIGENRAQDLIVHQNSLSQRPKAKGQRPINWHFIGHLQTNKINKVIGRINMLQSLDSLKLAHKLHKRLKILNLSLPVLIEVNIARDPTKFGIDPDNLYSFIEKLTVFDTLEIQGLMTMGKIWQSEKEARTHFTQMRQLFSSLKQLTTTTSNLQPTYLSMGMSSDYQWAIVEGANMIRIGRAVFG